MKYLPTTALKKIAKLRKRIRAVSGGTGASKTVAILMWLIDYAQCHKDEVIDVVSESYPHLDLGAIAEFKRIMMAQKYWDDKRWNGGAPRSYTFETGTVIQFVSYDSVGKAHGPRRDVLFINEANNMPWPIVEQLLGRTRKVIWFDWNPSEDFWFDDQILGKRDDVDFMGEGGNYPPLTYLDNEAYDEGQLSELLARKNDVNYWRVYGLGLKGQLEARIFNNWLTVERIPHEARLERYGVDFGYSNDPTAIVAIYYYNGGYIVDEIAFNKGLSNKQIADILLNSPRALVIADSAEPKSIDEIRMYGISIMPTTKGPGSVLQRIQLTQGQQISVTQRSLNILKEYRNYRWLVDKDGRVTSEPDHLWSHSMDAIMYGITSLAPIAHARDMMATMPRREKKKFVNPAK